MKKIFLLFVIVYFYQPISIVAQINSFVKVISPFLSNTLDMPFKVIRTVDNGYAFGGGDFYFFNLYKINSLGEIILKRKYEIKNLYPYSGGSFRECSDGGFIIITSDRSNDKLNNESFNPKLIRTNKYGEITWSKIYDLGFDEIGMAVTQTSDSGFVFICRPYNGNNNFLHIIKANKDSFLEWDTVYTISLPFTGKYDLLETLNSDLILQITKIIMKINSRGEFLWKESKSGLNYISLTRDNGYVCTGAGFYEKLDKDGNSIWLKKFQKTGNAIHQLNDGNYIISTDKGLVKTNFNGDTLWSKNYFFQPAFILPAFDNGFIIYTDYSGYNSLVKTDSTGFFNALGFIPNFGPILTYDNKYTIKWISNRIGKVDLDYSVDNGINWINIYSAIVDSGFFNWTIPLTLSGSCKLKLSNSSIPEINCISDSSFIISPNNSYDYIAINQIKMWIKNDGTGSHNPFNDGQGLYWPGGENATIGASFDDGLLWGGKINDELRVNGNTHRHGLLSGKILTNRKPGEPIPVWKIRKDWLNLPGGQERDKYEYNYENWPGDSGAPFTDIDGDNKFTKGIDLPRFLGDEVLWFAANDLDTSTSRSTLGSDPIGLEVQLTTFGYDSQDDLADVVFKKYKLINKSGKQIDDMYLAYWADPDLGYAGDDYAGCDTLLNLSYCYNADNDDEFYYGVDPPAIGYKFVQGPVTGGNLADSARIDDKWEKGKRNLPMTSFTIYIGGNLTYQDPNNGIYSGTLQCYSNMEGFTVYGNQFINPINKSVTKFVLSGDPVSDVGWYEGKGWPGGGFVPDDRRFLMSSGPFTMAPSDTQEIVLAIIMARGTNNINCVAELKRKARVVQEYYDSHIPTSMNDEKILVDKFELYQNYPNPFNPSTMIKYKLPINNIVTLKVFDILGQEVKTLVNEYQNAGFHSTLFTLNSSLTSGVYFYQLKAGSFVSTKKMLLIK